MQHLRILLVDDSFTINLDIRETLEENGFEVESVYCAGAAYEALDRGRPPLALVSDIDLGPGPNGFDVARRARANYPALPVVFISGTRSSCHPKQGVAGSEFLDKPVRSLEIIEALRRVICLEAEQLVDQGDSSDPAPSRVWRSLGDPAFGRRGATAPKSRSARPVVGGLAFRKPWLPVRPLRAPFITRRLA
ncbi:MAG: response regulator [Phenylobacterium sp.]|uniref:response regulator n=1 Tax=Phenylobacterium sp. TaxID=1871053 RepID=UPI0011FDABE5|nr:response regulator [Phenylobacterium sp.]TAJ71118.1 MAG: response regulator [Phenylobacterium sp.]